MMKPSKGEKLQFCMPSSVLKVDFYRILVWKEIRKFSQKAMGTTDVKTLDVVRIFFKSVRLG